MSRFLTEVLGFNPDGLVRVGSTGGRDLQRRIYSKKPRTVNDPEGNILLEDVRVEVFQVGATRPCVHGHRGQFTFSTLCDCATGSENIVIFTTGVLNIRLIEVFSSLFRLPFCSIIQILKGGNPPPPVCYCGKYVLWRCVFPLKERYIFCVTN
jgi:hypothetical protein